MGTVFQFGDFRFDTQKRLFRGSVQIPLAPRVGALLLELLEAGGSPISKEHMIEVCAAGANNVDAALARALHLLRKALGDTGHTIVKTNYGHGVSLAVAISQTRVQPPGQGMDLVSGQPPAATGEEMIRTAFELASNRSEEGLRLAGSVLAHAFERFPRLAYAPSLHADVLVSSMIRGYARPAAVAKQAFDLVAQALDVVPDLPSALATRGWLLGVILDDRPGGLTLIDRAIQASPGAWIARFYKAWLLTGERSLGAVSDVLEEGLAISPLERALLALKGWTLCARGMVAEADAFTQHALALRPDIDLLWIVRAIACLQTGDDDGARRSMGRAVALSPNDSLVQANDAWLATTLGKGEAGLDFLNRRARTPGYVSPVMLAMVRAAMADRVGAENLLRIAEADKDPWRLSSWCDPRLMHR